MMKLGGLNSLGARLFEKRAISANPSSKPDQNPVVKGDSVGALASDFWLQGGDINFGIPRNGVVRIGRLDGSDLKLQDDNVSRQHATIQVRDGQLFVRDSNSTNGTYLNDKKLKSGEWHALTPGGRLKMGDVELRVGVEQPVRESAPQPAELIRQTTRTAAQGAQPALPVGVGLVLQDLDSGEYRTLSGEGGLSVGRDTKNDLVVRDEMVSRNHATLYFKNGAVSILDNGSTNGTEVNGERLAPKAWSSIAAGDRLKLGKSKFRLVDTTPIDLGSKKDLEKSLDFRELVTDPGKQQEKHGQLVPDEPNAYWQNNVEARRVFEDYLDRGDYFQESSFENMLKDSHRLAVEGSSGENRYYKRSGAVAGPEKLPAGEFHEGVFGGVRDEESRQVEGIARSYGDPYRLDAKEPTKPVQLDGIKDEDLPQNMPLFGGQRHIYPGPKSFGDYFTQMRARLFELDKLPAESKQEKLKLIGEFYQYGANVRPFHNVNNSLFMNFTNSLLKRHGFKPVYHGLLDHAAHRLQPKAFNAYFQDWVNGQGKIV